MLTPTPTHGLNPAFLSLPSSDAALTPDTMLTHLLANSSMNGTDAGAGSGDSQGDWSSLIGIITAIVGNVLISFALNTQRYAHLRLGREAEEKAQARRDRLRRRRKSRVSAAGASEDAGKVGGAGGEDGSIGERGRDARGRTLTFEEEEEEDAGESAPLLGSARDEDEESEYDYDEEAVTAAAGGQNFAAAKQTSYLRSPWWWLGIILMTVGEAGNFLAYGFAPASIVSPLGVVALISNCIIAPIMLKEPFRKRDLMGVLVAVGGAVTVVLGAPDNNPKLGPHEIWDLITRWEFETYFGITAGTIVALMWASKEYGRKSIFIDLGLVGLFGGYTALSTKGVASLLSYTLFRALTFPVTYLMVFILVSTAILQIKYVNRALQRFDATQVIPTQFVLFTLSVILGSAILYRDFERTTGRDAGKFIGGCALTFLGVWFITSGRPRDDEDEDRAPETEHSIHLEAGEQYTDDEPARSASRRPSPSPQRPSAYAPSMASLTLYPSSTSEHHRRPTLPHMPTPAITLTSEPSSQAVTTTTTPAADEVPYSMSLTTNPWAVESLISAQLTQPTLHTTASAPILPSEAQTLEGAPAADRPLTPRNHSARPDTAISPRASSGAGPRPGTPPPPVSPAKKSQSSQPATPAHTSIHAKRGSISLLPGPLTSPLSASLSAVVADSLRKGVEMRSGVSGASGAGSGGIGIGIGRPRRGTRDSLSGGGFGSWLNSGVGVGGIAGPRDSVGDTRRRSAAEALRGVGGVQIGEGEGEREDAREGARDGGEGGAGAGAESATQKRARGRSLSSAFGGLLGRVGLGEREGEQQTQQSQQQRGEARGEDAEANAEDEGAETR